MVTLLFFHLQNCIISSFAGARPIAKQHTSGPRLPFNEIVRSWSIVALVACTTFNYFFISVTNCNFLFDASENKNSSYIILLYTIIYYIICYSSFFSLFSCLSQFRFKKNACNHLQPWLRPSKGLAKTAANTNGLRIQSVKKGDLQRKFLVKNVELCTILANLSSHTCPKVFKYQFIFGACLNCLMPVMFHVSLTHKSREEVRVRVRVTVSYSS